MRDNMVGEGVSEGINWIRDVNKLVSQFCPSVNTNIK